MKVELQAVQIGDENLHHVKEILDEVFGHKTFFAYNI